MAVLYSDINQYNPAIKPILINIESIFQSIYNLLGTSKGERIFRPDIGLDIDNLLFQLGNSPDDIDGSFSLLNLVIAGIRQYEPRVTPDFGRSSVEQDINNNGYTLNLVFQILGLGNEYFEVKGSFL
jgi:phage baseplate assembly protein W